MITPVQFRIAADSRLCKTQYANDQIWEICARGDPPALAIQTTFGLRARMVRLYPGFGVDKELRTNPTEFPSPVELAYYYPNACGLRFSPLQNIDVYVEYWVPESWLLIGRIRLENSGVEHNDFQLELIGQLSAFNQGQAMGPVSSQVTTMLRGRAGNLVPTLFLTGGPQPGNGPYPSLKLDMSLDPGASRQLTWALASLTDEQAAGEAARHATARPWEAELTRIELMNTRNRVQITTGDPIYNDTIRRAQDEAFQLLHSPTPKLAYTSFVATRKPDQGYSVQGEGIEYGPLWSGQTAFQGLSLAGALLPGAAEIVQGFVRNHLNNQDARGRVDWKVGLAGQRGGLLVQPVLATLAWKASRSGEDKAFLAEVYPALQRYLNVWFSPANDRDGDGVPEYDHPYQSTLEELPLFDRWGLQNQGVEINTLETPALSTFLYEELVSLGKIADCIQHVEDVQLIQPQASRLLGEIQSTWDEQVGIFRYRDRDTHYSPSREILYKGPATDRLMIQHHFSIPQRLVLRVYGMGEKPPAGLRIVGDGYTGANEEVIPGSAWRHTADAFWTTSRLAFRSIGELQIPGSLENVEIQVSTPDLAQEDLSLFLPLWAGIPTADQASRMLTHLMDRYAAPGGLTLLPVGDQGTISFPWNHLVIEGLLRYGYRQEALELYGRLVQTAAASLEETGDFARLYSATGERLQVESGHVEGLLSPELFLELLGIQIYSPWKVFITGNSPLDLPVTVKYRGQTIVRQLEKTEITFPDGQTACVTGIETYLITQPHGSSPASK